MARLEADQDSKNYVTAAIEELENALVCCGPGSDTPNWEHYAQIANLLCGVVRLLQSMEWKPVAATPF